MWSDSPASIMSLYTVGSLHYYMYTYYIRCCLLLSSALNSTERRAYVFSLYILWIHAYRIVSASYRSKLAKILFLACYFIWNYGLNFHRSIVRKRCVTIILIFFLYLKNRHHPYLSDIYIETWFWPSKSECNIASDVMSVFDIIRNPEYLRLDYFLKDIFYVSCLMIIYSSHRNYIVYIFILINKYTSERLTLIS